ncbi:MAG: hypothetical protein KBS61_08150, partial [Chryseobacterium sp.]|nr:hypothetical protein [Candidatus Chryseobacterium enterohippi]
MMFLPWIQSPISGITNRPQRASHDVEKYIKKQLKNRENQNVILIGYSFGSEVAPFIYNRFTE